MKKNNLHRRLTTFGMIVSDVFNIILLFLFVKERINFIISKENWARIKDLSILEIKKYKFSPFPNRPLQMKNV